MKITSNEYKIADEYLEYLRQKNCRERATVTLIKEKELRVCVLEELETESHAINILRQVLEDTKRGA